MKAIFVLIFLTGLPLFGQIKVDKAGDGWDLKVDSALTLIRETDPTKYALLDSVCANVSFWLSDFSSCESEEEGGRIYISVRDVKLNSINNLASVLVHESFHLYIWKRKFILSPKEEENYCYRYELELVSKLPNLEPWLKAHVIEQIKNTQN
jgi:hypothetical protein